MASRASQHERMRYVAVLLAIAVGAAGMGWLSAPSADADGLSLPYRVVLPQVVAGEEPPPAPSAPVPAADVPPPGPGYCLSNSPMAPPTPPNTVIGLLTIGGEPAPAGTLVTLTFDGHPGPSARTTAAGGYHVRYAAGGQGHEPRCINEVGSELGLLVNGQLVRSGVAVGDPAAYLVFRFDVAVP